MYTVPMVVVVLAALWAFRRAWFDISGARVMGITMVGCALMTLLAYGVGSYQMYFNEVWNFKANSIQYYEEWNEKVPCRHPKYKTKTRTVTDSKGRMHTETYEVFDGYKHAFDVDDHPPRWVAQTEYGERSITQDDYRHWRDFWGGEHFNDMHRDYYTINGNMYECRWPGTVRTIYPFEEVKLYQNKVRVSSSVFNYKTVSKATAQKYPRPVDKGITGAVYSYDNTPFSDQENLLLRQINADLGPKYKVHALVLLWNADTDSSVMDDALAAWKGPNKNELVISIGLGENRQIRWCQVYSWCDDTTINAKMRQDVESLTYLRFPELGDTLMNDIPKLWQKKNFHDFDYLSVPMPWWSWLLCIVLCAGVGAGAIFMEENDIWQNLKR